MSEKAPITLWGGPDTARNRPVRAQRPCPCGCDDRGRDEPMIGYISGSDSDGNGLTIEAPDEATYQRFVAIFGEGE
jgi:hypothetical protein